MALSHAIPIEADCLTPDNLASKSLAEIAALPVQHGNRTEPLGQFFDIEGDPTDREIRIDGDCAKVKRIGLAMKSGRIVARRQRPGMHAGRPEMTGRRARGRRRRRRLGRRRDGRRPDPRPRQRRQPRRGGVSRCAARDARRRPPHRRQALPVARSERRCAAALIAVERLGRRLRGANLIAGSIFLFGRPGVQASGRHEARRTPRPFSANRRRCCPRSAARPATTRPVFLSLYLRKLVGWGFGPAAAAGRSGPLSVGYLGDLASARQGREDPEPQ